MKKLLLKALLPILLLTFTACGSKVPFVKEDALQDASLVYIYAPISVGSTDDMSDLTYKVRINNKRVEGKLKDGEYMRFALKPNKTTLSVTRHGVEEQVITLDLKGAEIYYLKADADLESDTFNFEIMDDITGLKEIARTNLAGETAVEEKDVLTELIEEKKEQTNTSLSKTEEIEKAYSLKEKGILTDDEFKKLKAEILAK